MKNCGTFSNKCNGAELDMKIYLCDDEKKILEDMKQMVQQCQKNCEVNTYTSGMELVKSLKEAVCDILLLDIDMPGLSGMDIAKWLVNLEKKPLLIFVTSHDELVYESFQYHPFGFIRKDYFGNEIKKVLDDCVKESLSSTKYFNFRTEGKDIRVPLSEIKYFEADGNYLKVFTDNGRYRFRSTLTAVENTLGHQGFIRIHKGFLVNQLGVRIFSGDEAQLTDGTALPIGKTYVEEAKNKLMRYMR